MRAVTKKLVVLSDLHVGSTVGLWPDKFKTHEGFEVSPNEFQKWLLECWQDCQKWIKAKTAGSRYELLLNGDLVEGVHHRSLEIMTPDPNDMARAAIALLEPVSGRATKTYLTVGTECHVRNMEAWIGKEIGAVRDKVTGHHASDRIELEFGDHLLAASHHMPTSARPYLEASAHSISLGAEIMERARCGKKPPSIIVRAHRHLHGVWSDGTAMSLSTGAWQGLTRFGSKVVPYAVPRPSCVILDFEGCQKGDLPVVHQRVYIAE